MLLVLLQLLLVLLMVLLPVPLLSMLLPVANAGVATACSTGATALVPLLFLLWASRLVFVTAENHKGVYLVGLLPVICCTREMAS